MQLGLSVARGLARAHERGIVHRDLKPENVVVTWARDLKILDFGLAKLREGEGSLLYSEETASNVTLEGKVTGTPGYMAPEQVTGKEVSCRTDVFTFGVLFYEMLTGTNPFRGETVMDVLIASTRDEPLPVGTRNPALTEEIAAIVARCLAKNPAGRFANAGEIVTALESLEAAPHVEPSPALPVPPEAAPVRRKPLLFAAAWGAPVLVAAGIAIAVAAVPRSEASALPSAPVVAARPLDLTPAASAPPSQAFAASPSIVAPLPASASVEASDRPRPPAARRAPVASTSRPAVVTKAVAGSSRPPAAPVVVSPASSGARQVELGSANIPIVE